MREDVDFIKEGNFSPMSVLNPELGMEAAIFAKDRSSSMSDAYANISGRASTMSNKFSGGEERKISLDEAHTKVTDMLSKIEETIDVSLPAKMLEKPPEKRYKGRRRKISVEDEISNLSHPGQDRGRDFDMMSVKSTNSSNSSGYISSQESREFFTSDNRSGKEGEKYSVSLNLNFGAFFRIRT